MTRSFAVFSGADSNNLDSLWVSDGTAAGTVPLAVAGAGGGGLFYNIYGAVAISPDFTAFSNMLLFMGVDTAGVIGLWRSDGTAAGTYEITVNGGNPSGVDSGGSSGAFAVLGGTAYFDGLDANNNFLLWSTQGTAATTAPVAVPNAASDLNPTGLTGFAGGSKVLFFGYSASNIAAGSMYVITAAGVSEVQNIAPGTGFSPNPADGTAALGNAVVFGASAQFANAGPAATIGPENLWITDGTAAGTQPLTTNGVVPTFITSLGSYVLYAGGTSTTTSYSVDLWYSGGSAASTHELAPANAWSGGLLAGVTPDFTRLNPTQVLFVGRDAAGNDGLWSTDGTAADTNEIAVSGAGPGGVFGNLGGNEVQPQFALLNGRILFYGQDASGMFGLWSTDGTAPGTVELPVANAMTGGLGLSPSDLTSVTLCFAAGTRIATPDGETPVEHLRPGDEVLTLGGARTSARAVRWVGQFSVDLARHPAPSRAAPVRIRAHAFAQDVPRRDVLLSPDHAVLFRGALFHARALLNGASVVQEFPRRITYVHVELDSHAVLLAEGLPAESYLDLGTRGCFDGEAGTRPLFPDLAAAAWDGRACAPLLLDGPRLAAARAHLAARISAGRTAARSRRASA